MPRERLVSYWTGEATASGRRLDEIGSNHLGFTEATAPGKVGTASDFTGTNFLRTFLDTNSVASSLTSVGRDLSYAGWIRFDALNADQVISARWGGWAPGREHRLYLDSAAGQVKLVWANAENTARTTTTAPQAMVVGQWYFVAYGRSDSPSEIWLSVTPDSSPGAQARTTVSWAATNPAAQAMQHEFGANDGGTRMDGQWNQWGVYRGTLSADELDWLFHAGAGRTVSDFVYVQAPVMGYRHDFEQEGAASGRYSYQSFMENASILPEQHRDGAASLKVKGAWGQIQVFNNSNTNYWCTTDECKVSSDVYVTTFVGSSMWFQMDGKSNNPDLDTNEGVGVQFYDENGNRGFSMGRLRTAGYNLPLNQWVHLTYLFKRNAAPPQKNVELYADGVLIAASGSDSGAPVVAKAWHHISLGNDRNASPLFFIDNFSVRPIARLNDPPEVDSGPDQTATVGQVLALNATVNDIDGDAVTAAWSKVSGTGAVLFADATAIDTTASFSEEGSYVLRLSASDATAASGDDVTVTVRR